MLTKRKPVHPGELFKEEVLIPLGTYCHACGRGSGSVQESLIGAYKLPFFPKSGNGYKNRKSNKDFP